MVSAGGDERPEFDAFERSAWQGREHDYAAVFAGLTGLAAQALVGAARVGRGDVVLEVGCGSGVVSAVVAATGAAVVVSDASPAMVRLARRAAPTAVPVCAALPALPLASGSVDAVVGGFVVNPLGDPGAAFAQIRRVVRPGGRVAVTCWDRSRGRTAPTALFDRAVRRPGIGVPSVPVGPPGLTSPGLDALLRDASWQEVRVERLRLVRTVDPEVWWRGLTAGTARIGAVFDALDVRRRRAVRAAYDELVGDRLTDDGQLRLEAVALLGHATARPSTVE